jgi:myo-inositol 2-dehydrogenase/D-chiro-inositol 1-dehydrogenase
MAIVDTMVHDIDTARWLLDDEIASVRIFAGRPNRAGGDLRDPILGVMQTAGGALITVEVSVNIAYGYDIRGEISGETGTVALAESNCVVVKSAGSHAGRVPEDWRERFITAYDVEIAEWITAAAQGGATGPSAWDGYTAAVVCDAGVEAAKTGEAVNVNLIDKPGLYG